MPTTPTVSPTAPAASNTRRTAAGVKADRRSPEGRGLDTGEDRRTLTKAGTTPIPNPDHVHNADDRARSYALAAFPERLLGLRSSRVRTRLCRKWAVAPSLRMKDVQHADGGSGSDDHDRCQIESKAE